MIFDYVYLPKIIKTNKFYFIRNGIWYEITKYDFKELVHFNSPCRHITQLTMDIYIISTAYNINHSDDYMLIHQYYSLKSISRFDIEFDRIMYGVDYEKT